MNSKFVTQLLLFICCFWPWNLFNSVNVNDHLVAVRSFKGIIKIGTILFS